MAAAARGAAGRRFLNALPNAMAPLCVRLRSRGVLHISAQIRGGSAAVRLSQTSAGPSRTDAGLHRTRPPDPGQTLPDPGGFRRTPPPDPPGPRTDPGRTRHRTIRTRGTGGAHLQPDCDQRRAPRTTHTDSLAAGSIAQRASNSYLYRSRKAKSARARQIQSCDLPELLSALRNSAHRRSFKRWTYTIRL